MLASKSSLKRRLQIVELVRKRGEASVEELSQIFEVSSVTIRSDLTYLEQQRYLVRSLGKARYLAQKAGENILASVVDEATRKASETAIARFASEAVDDHESLMVGAGAISHRILPFLSDRSNLALLIHDLEMARTAQRFLHCELVLTGGQLEDDTTVLTGPDTEATVGRRSIDVCFLEAAGLDRDGNLLCVEPAVARVFAAARAAAKKTIVVAYQPQLNERVGEAFASLEQVDALYMDDGLDPEMMELMPKNGFQLHRPDSGILEFRKDVKLPAK
jgi:DeoR/GlpR family transcriptional regulator of sugar metabolism